MTERRALVTGGSGQLGSDLAEQLTGWQVSAPAHSELDITDDTAVAAAIESTRPSVVFNCAAYHRVDACEGEEARSFEVNVSAVKRLAERCAQNDSLLVHFSTNYVFDGKRDEPYGENDLPAPESVYAISKLAGERAALTYAAESLVVRSAGLYGLRGSASKGGNFVERVLARAREHGELQMVSDQRLTPTFTADLAAALIEAVMKGARGLVHLTNAGSCSWYEFTQAILELAAVEAVLEPATTTVEPGIARRPLNGVLARPRADELGLTPLRHWREALADYFLRRETGSALPG